jgi:SAM-dependent methyltransferase
MKRYTKEQLEKEISKRAPWYQSIDFPEYGASTTDKPENAFNDEAWDNKIGDINIEEATRLRPKPKYRAIIDWLPKVMGLDVLEIGCNCGFFSLEFARNGANSVTGLDVAPKWLANAEWSRSVLEFDNVQFHNCDFMLFDGLETKSEGGLLDNGNENIPLPNNRYDLVFTSTVLDHLFFPLFAIYKMIRISRKWVVIDVPQIDPRFKDESLMKLSYPKDLSHHGFNGSKSLFLGYFQRLGIPKSDIEVHEYNNGLNITYILNTTNFADRLIGA